MEDQRPFVGLLISCHVLSGSCCLSRLVLLGDNFNFATSKIYCSSYSYMLMSRIVLYGLVPSGSLIFNYFLYQLLKGDLDLRYTLKS